MTNAEIELDYADMPGPHFIATSVTTADAHVVSLVGELDVNTSGQVSAILGGPGELAIVVDMTNLGFMDCCGYRALASARRSAEQAGNTFTIVHAHGQPALLLGLLDELGLL